MPVVHQNPFVPASPETGAVVGRLADARGVIEDKFLELGRVLEGSIEVVGGLIGGLDELAGVFADGAVDAATSNLLEAASQLNGLADGRGEDRIRFEAMGHAALMLGAHIEAMQQALRYLHVFAVNIKVTAGGVPGAYEEFADFAEEVLAAITQGRDELVEFERELAKLAEQVAAAVAHEQGLDRRCAELLPATPDRLSADALTLAEHHKRVATAAGEAVAIARSVEQKVGGALCSLQVGDTTRQRVEHVEDGLALAARARTDRSLGEAGEAVVRGMLAAQLDDTADAFGREIERMTASLSGVAADASQVLRLRDVARGVSRRGDQGGVLARLEASLDQAMSLVRDLGEAETAAADVGQLAEATAAGLSRRINSIRRIRSSINQMAMNAHLKCCRLGDAGRPLSVIAVELRVSADDLGDKAGAAEAILSQLSGAAARRDAGQPDGDARSAAVGGLLDAAVAPIRAADAKVGGDLAALAERGEAMISGLRQATARLNVRAEVGAVLTDVARILGDDGGADPSGDPGFTIVMAEIERLYTMARERQVHRTFVVAEEENAA